MPNINDVFPSKYLKSHDLQGKEPTVTIARVELESMGQGAKRELVPVLYFRGKAKALKLNKTMANAIAAVVGSADTDAWIGKAVTLYATSADFGGQQYPVVRVKAPVSRAVSRPRPVPPPVVTAPARATGTDGGPLTLDDIPF